MLGNIAISLLLLPLCTGAPTDLKRWPHSTGPEANHQEHTPPLIHHYMHEGAALIRIMSEYDARCLELYLSPFKVNDLYDKKVGGWASFNHGQDGLGVLQQAMPELEGLAGVRAFESPASKVNWADEKLWIDETMSLALPSGKFKYRNLMSGSNGFIISILSQSEKIAIPDWLAADTKKERRLRRWSDVTFFEYGAAMVGGDFGKTNKDFLEPAPEGYIPVHKKGAPTWFLQHDIEKAKDLSTVIGFCLETHHHWKLTSWPGVTFPIGSACYTALLGTETTTEIAMFLIRYRTVIGRGLLGSVTAFKDKAGKANLLWWAAYDDATVEKLWPDVAEENAKADDAAGGKFDTPASGFPHPLNPVRR